MARVYDMGINMIQQQERAALQNSGPKDLNPLTDHQLFGFQVYGQEEGADFILTVRSVCGTIPERRVPIHKRFIKASTTLDCIINQTSFKQEDPFNKSLVLPDARWMRFIDHLLRFLYVPNNFDIDMACFRGGLEDCIQVCFCADYLQFPEDTWWKMFYHHMESKILRYDPKPGSVPGSFWFLPEQHFLSWLRMFDWKNDELVYGFLRWFGLDHTDYVAETNSGGGSNTGSCSSNSGHSVPFWEHRLVAALSDVLKLHPDHGRVRAIYREQLQNLREMSPSVCRPFRSASFADVDWPRFPDGSQDAIAPDAGMLIWQPATTYLSVQDIANLQAAARPFTGRVRDMVLHWFREIQPWCRGLLFHLQHYDKPVSERRLLRIAKFSMQEANVAHSVDAESGIRRLVDTGLLRHTGLLFRHTSSDREYFMPRVVRDFLGGKSPNQIVRDELATIANEELVDMHWIKMYPTAQRSWIEYLDSTIHDPDPPPDLPLQLRPRRSNDVEMSSSTSESNPREKVPKLTHGDVTMQSAPHPTFSNPHVFSNERYDVPMFGLGGRLPSEIMAENGSNRIPWHDRDDDEEPSRNQSSEVRINDFRDHSMFTSMINNNSSSASSNFGNNVSFNSTNSTMVPGAGSISFGHATGASSSSSSSSRLPVFMQPETVMATGVNRNPNVITRSSYTRMDIPVPLSSLSERAMNMVSSKLSPEDRVEFQRAKQRADTRVKAIRDFWQNCLEKLEPSNHMREAYLPTNHPERTFFADLCKEFSLHAKAAAASVLRNNKQTKKELSDSYRRYVETMTRLRLGQNHPLTLTLYNRRDALTHASNGDDEGERLDAISMVEGILGSQPQAARVTAVRAVNNMNYGYRGARRS